MTTQTIGGYYVSKNKYTHSQNCKPHTIYGIRGNDGIFVQQVKRYGPLLIHLYPLGCHLRPIAGN